MFETVHNNTMTRLPLISLICLLALAYTQGQTIKVCRPGYEKAGNRCYKLSTKQMNWPDAADYCEKDGSEIAGLETNTERDLVSALVKHHKNNFTWKFKFSYWGHFWIGGFYSRWTGSGVAADRYYWHRNFGKPEPISGVQLKFSAVQTFDRDCLLLRDDGVPTDYFCNQVSFGVICEDSPKEIDFPPQ